MSVTTASLWQDERPKRNYAESELQRSVHRYLQMALPSDAVHFAVPNGLMRSRKARARAVGEGILAGVPDLAVCWRGRTIFIELKAKGGSLSPAQRDMHNRLVFCGFEVVVCRSLECVCNSLAELGIPLRGRVAV